MATRSGPEDVDWSLATFDGLRRQQMREFAALPFRAKLLLIEELTELAERLQACQPQRPPEPSRDTHLPPT